MDLIGFYKTFHPIAVQYTFFSVASGTFFKTHHILCHKTTLKKQNIYIISCILSNHNEQKRNKHKKLQNNANTRRMNSMHLNNQWVVEEIGGGVI